jgi:hypothetical protein
LAVDVCTADLEVFKEVVGVFGHVDQRVRHRTRPANQVTPDPGDDRTGCALSAHLGRKTDVAVVVADHPISPLEQQGTEAFRPHRQLRAHAHDQEDGWGVGVAKVLVEQLNGA